MAESSHDKTRRQFLGKLGLIGAGSLATLFFAKDVFLYLFPKNKKANFHKYLVAKTDELKIGEAKEISLGATPVFIIHLEEGYKAFSGICTHLGCIVSWEKEKNRFYCPCHKGYFDKDGTVLAGPPPRPLDEYAVMVEEEMVFINVPEKTKGPWA